MRRVEWVIINEDNMEEKLNELRGTGQPLALFSLTGEGYENLGLNFSDIRALVQQQQQIIIAYENYYKDAEAALDDANKQVSSPQIEEGTTDGFDWNPFN